MNALFVVDLVTPGGSPSRTLMDFIPHHWIRSLKELEAMNLDYIISGHGVPIAHPSALTERREYLEALLEAVKAGGDKGLPEPELHKFVREQMQPFAYMRNFDSRLEYQIIRIGTYFYTGW
jgi:glyoxylase-like metal-dependent hydrolase (beta-lactamase superfamily II)